jgi:pyruvate dehydrogenase E1 component alpha subunit
MRRDPLVLARQRLAELGLSDAELAEADARADQTVRDAVQAAKEAPAADPQDALTDVWADGSAAWRT